ncbi:MAG: glycosyltransferase family 4 protein [Candidatus Moraniibacteriota bacterium]|nr:MAG: glycosyltransferase family 4 protein [Candidatus Moranbacteria bacterium]
MPFRILFISRAYPPIVGGIENQNAALALWLQKHAEVTTIANRFGKKFLPIFLPYALCRAILSARNYDAILLGDGVLSIVGWAVKILFPKKAVISVIHGLDITYPLFIYQALWVRIFIPKLDKLIAVGNETIALGIRHGIADGKFEFVPNGIDPEAHYHPEFTRRDLEGVIGDIHKNQTVLLTAGRLARRKGVTWFIRNVLPLLPRETIYVVAGDGPDRDNIRRAIEETKTFERVKLLGYVSDRARDILMNTCDIFVQPNIRIPGDVEGFGITPIEAASCGIPVIVSRLEGLKDAFTDDKNGVLAESEDIEDWKKKAERFLSDKELRKTFGERARRYTAEHFNWKTISACYAGIIKAVVAQTTGERELHL